MSSLVEASDVAETRSETRIASFSDTYRASFARVYTATLAFCGDADIAEEATQEAFARAFAHWRRIGREQWVIGWIVTTAMNDARRRSRKRSGTPPVAPSVTAPEVGGLELLDSLRTLPQRQRQVAILHYIHDLPVDVVADLLGISAGSVKTHLSRARSALAQLLGGELDD
jgi:RNA polymerase sigma-70 factor, ECF subfamily